MMSNGGVSGGGLTVDNANNIYITGYYVIDVLNIYNQDDPINPAFTLPPPLVINTYIVKYNTDGFVQWATYDGGSNPIGTDICINKK